MLNYSGLRKIRQHSNGKKKKKKHQFTVVNTGQRSNICSGNLTLIMMLGLNDGENLWRRKWNMQ